MLATVSRRLGGIVALLIGLIGVPALIAWVVFRVRPQIRAAIDRVSLEPILPATWFIAVLILGLTVFWVVGVVCLIVELQARLGRSPSRRWAVIGALQSVVGTLLNLALGGTRESPWLVPESTLRPLPTSRPSAGAAWSPTAGSRELVATPSFAAAGRNGHRSAAAVVPSGMTGPVGPEWVVAKGDTLWSIAEQTLGNPLRFAEIAELNNGATGRSRSTDAWLRVGLRLRLPDDAVRTGPEDDLGRRTPAVTVQAGDSLWSLAERHLGDPTRFTELASENGLGVDDPIVVGQRLMLPPAGESDPLAGIGVAAASHGGGGEDAAVSSAGDDLGRIQEALAAALHGHGQPAPIVLSGEFVGTVLTLVLARPVQGPTPFRTTDNGRRWSIDAATLAADSPAPGRGRRPLPTLVPIGTRIDPTGSADSVTVLIECEQLGAVEITGDHTERRRLLHRLAVELAATGTTEVITVGWGIALAAAAAAVRYESDPAAAIRAAGAQLDRIAVALAARGGDIVQARAAGGPADWAPHVLLIDADVVDPAVGAVLSALINRLTASGRQGAAVVLSTGQTGRFGTIPASLSLAPDGTLTLPAGLSGAVLTGRGLSDAEAVALVRDR